MPYVKEGMSMKQLGNVIDGRDKLFEQGLVRIINALAVRMETFLHEIETVSSEAIKEYQEWMKPSKERACD